MKSAFTKNKLSSYAQQIAVHGVFFDFFFIFKIISGCFLSCIDYCYYLKGVCPGLEEYAEPLT